MQGLWAPGSTYSFIPREAGALEGSGLRRDGTWFECSQAPSGCCRKDSLEGEGGSWGPAGREQHRAPGKMALP